MPSGLSSQDTDQIPSNFIIKMVKKTAEVAMKPSNGYRRNIIINEPHIGKQSKKEDMSAMAANSLSFPTK
nr:hypothetical protein [Tanacetum cinerariifolium]